MKTIHRLKSGNNESAKQKATCTYIKVCETESVLPWTSSDDECFANYKNISPQTQPPYQ